MFRDLGLGFREKFKCVYHGQQEAVIVTTINLDPELAALAPRKLFQNVVAR